jgi:hypothetical protein
VYVLVVGWGIGECAQRGLFKGVVKRQVDKNNKENERNEKEEKTGPIPGLGKVPCSKTNEGYESPSKRLRSQKKKNKHRDQMTTPQSLGR